MDAKSGSLASSSQQATPGAAKDNVTKPKVSKRSMLDEIRISSPLWPSVFGPLFMDPMSSVLTCFLSQPCCVCKEEKSKRDECMLFSKAADPASDCKSFVEQYKSCMAGFGFTV
ncbi:hypothetical protein E4U22_005409 [Claviceps purpurea]|nr:hypothetical protein E4U22_005409 [Claviceps purpurea]